MNSANDKQIRTIKKQYIETAVNFAIENIPGIDHNTLSKYLELVNVTGNFGSVSEDELLEKVRLFRKYLPGTCQFSLQVLVDLLGISAPAEHLSQPAVARLPYKREVPFSFTVNPQAAAAQARLRN